MNYIIYKITNLINNKIYIGAHKCEDINDDYMGSGKHLKYAQNKYGIENFEKEILEVFDTSEEMFNMEASLVNEEFIKDKETYNIKLGGLGGWDFINQNTLQKVPKSIEGYKKCMEAAKRGGETTKMLHIENANWSKKVSSIISLGLKEYYKNNDNAFKGKKHSDEAKKKIGEANSKHQKGEGNSQFGKIWIYNLDEKVSKRIEKDELPEYLDLGWLKGRKIKF